MSIRYRYYGYYGYLLECTNLRPHDPLYKAACEVALFYWDKLADGGFYAGNKIGFSPLYIRTYSPDGTLGPWGLS